MTLSKRFFHLPLLLMALVLASLTFFHTASLHAQAPKRHVLLINSYQATLPWVKNVVRATMDTLKPRENGITVHTEFMDTKQTPYSTIYKERFRRLLETKYAHRAFDLIMVSDNNAFDFIREFGGDLFPGVPVVFCGVNDFKDEQIADDPHITGVAETFDAETTLKTALELHPGTRRLLVINDHLPTGKAWTASIQKQIRGYEERLKIEYAGDLSFEALEERVAQLPPDAIALLGVYFKDREGRYFEPWESARRLSDSNAIPLYGLLDLYLGHGIVGGSLISGYHQGEMAALLGLKILSGTPPSSLPVVKTGSNQLLFDFDELKRRSLSPEQLPPKSQVINQPRSLLSEYAEFVWAAGIAIMALLLLVLALLAAIARRRKAEQALMESQEQLELRVRERTRELSDSEERFNQFMTHSPLVAFIKNARGEMVFANRAWEEITGVRDGRWQGQTSAAFYPPETAEKLHEDDRKIMTGDKPMVFEETIPMQGKLHHWLAHKFPFTNARGERFLGSVAIDITERIEAEEQIRAAQREAERANQSKSAFLANMSHEIRTPMNAIFGMGEVLAESSLTPEQRKHLDVLTHSSENLLSLINDILDVSKIEAGQLKIDHAPFLLRRVMAQVVKVLGMEAERKGVALTLTIAEEVPPQVMGDPLRFRQILTNLIGNALKFTPHGEVTVALDREEDDLFHLTVADTGIGMGPDILETIFDPFHQAENSTSRRFGGAGLGLTICRQLTTMMGGRIWAESVLGQGSLFHVTLPFDRVDVAEAPTAVPGPTEESNPSADETDGERRRVLLVDDAEDNRMVVQAFLKNSRFDLEMAENGAEGLGMAQAKRYDLILMDIQMPVMDGCAATRKIREWEAQSDAPPLPVIALTANALKEDVERAMSAGCDQYLTKPIRKRRLLEAMENALKEPVPAA